MDTPELHRLIKVIEDLRHPENGCPWDLEQTHQSLLRFLQEETYEFMHAVESNDDSAMEDEIGDVLLQVLLHAKIASEANRFDLESIAKNLADKMIRRHPHVFEKGCGGISSDKVVENWNSIKQKEKEKKGQNNKVKHLDESYLAFPALYSSYKIGKKTHEINFDWDSVIQVVYKVEEEWQELKAELAPQKPNIDLVAEELGDFLFSAAQLARHLGLEPEEILRQANKKFLRRFSSMENFMSEDGHDIKKLNQKQLDDYWNRAKLAEKK